MEKGICFLLPEIVAGFLLLVEHRKVLLVSPCPLTLLVFKGLHNLRQIRDHKFWVNMCHLYRV
jgi:hypothetical protein